MTKYIDLSSTKTESPKETEFKKCLDEDLEIGDAMASPNRYDNVAFIGHDKEYGDVFKCWDDDENDFTLFFGTKGDEFNS